MGKKDETQNNRNKKRGNAQDANYLRKVRNEVNMTQKQLSYRLNMSVSTIAKIEGQEIAMSKKVRDRIEKIEKENDKDLYKIYFKDALMKCGLSKDEALKYLYKLEMFFFDLERGGDLFLLGLKGNTKPEINANYYYEWFGEALGIFFDFSFRFAHAIANRDEFTVSKKDERKILEILELAKKISVERIQYNKE